MKKADQLARLCHADVALIIPGTEGITLIDPLITSSGLPQDQKL